MFLTREPPHAQARSLPRSSEKSPHAQARSLPLFQREVSPRPSEQSSTVPARSLHTPKREVFHCSSEKSPHALKGQKLLAQGCALGNG